MTESDAATPHYRRPGRMTRLMNRAVALATRRGLSVWGSRVLETTGRTSGLPRTTPVNLLTVDGSPYLVSARGHTEWVRNVRAADGALTLILGTTRTPYRADEITDPATAASILRAYLARWKAEVGVFFDGVGPDSTEAELIAVAGDHPVFALHSA